MFKTDLSPQALIAAAICLVLGLSIGGYLAYGKGAPVQVNVVEDKRPVIGKEACARFHPTGGFEFEADYFTDTAQAFRKHVQALAGKPINYLEVGTFEGRSMVWMLQNVLTHPESQAVGIDIRITKRYIENLIRSGGCEKVVNVAGTSQDRLRDMPQGQFDVIYIDGSHLGQHVLVDAVLAFDLLKVGGIMIFDDYKWMPDWANDMRPQYAIDSFVTMYRHQLEFVHRGYQVIVRKRAHPCAFEIDRYTPVGAYCYHWVSGDLFTQKKEPVTLQPAEREIVAAIARSYRFGEIEPDITKLASQPGYRAVNARLKLFP
jgi:predicted O-methyltransferase YrrM